MSGETAVRDAVNRATDSRVVRFIARAGYPISGTLHLLIAYMILRIAVGFKGEADQTGALATLASSGGGAVPLWIVAAGLIALAMWGVAGSVPGLASWGATGAGERRAPIQKKLEAFWV